MPVFKKVSNSIEGYIRRKVDRVQDTIRIFVVGSKLADSVQHLSLHSVFFTEENNMYGTVSAASIHLSKDRMSIFAWCNRANYIEKVYFQCVPR